MAPALERVPWAEVLRVAHVDASDRLRQLAHAQADKGRKGLTLEGVSIALRQAALRLEQPTVDRSDYTRARTRILAATRRTRHARIAARAIPPLSSIDSLLRARGMSWQQALERVGLAAPERLGQPGMELRAAVDAFIEDTGKAPRYMHDLRRWGTARAVSLAWVRFTAADARRFIEEVLEEQRRDGLPELQPASEEDHAALATAERSNAHPPGRRMNWNRARIIHGMALATKLLGRGQHLDQRSLKRIAAERRDLPIPSYSVVGRHLKKHPGENWEGWRREAETRAREIVLDAGHPPPPK